MADEKQTVNPIATRDDLAATFTNSLKSSRKNVLNLLNEQDQQIETANEGLARTLQDSNQITNTASQDLMDALRIKKDLAETPRIVKGIMSLLGHDEYNERIQDLRIQESNAKLGVASRRLKAGEQAYNIAVESIQNQTQSAVTRHTLERQNIFDAFSISANISEEQQRQLQGVDDKTLAMWKSDPGKAPKFISGKPGLIDSELRRRQSSKAVLSSQQIANQRTQLALDNERRDATLADLTNDQIAAINSGKMALPSGLKPRDVELELEQRQSFMLSLDAARMANDAGNIQLAERHIDQALKNNSSAKLQEMVKQAKAKDGSITLNGVKISADRLQTMAAAKRAQEKKLLNEAVSSIVDATAAEANLKVAETQFSNLANLANDKQLDPVLNAKVQEHKGRINVAASAGATDVVATEIKALQELAEKEIENAVTKAPKSERPARREYLMTGQVRSPEAAFTLVGTSLMSPTALADNHVLGPVWRDASDEMNALQVDAREGVPLFKRFRQGEDNTGGFGININQPKKAEDDLAVQTALRKSRVDEKLGQVLYQKALAHSLAKMHETLLKQGINSPYGQYVTVVNGVPELSNKMYAAVPVDPNKPNGPVTRQFDPDRLWSELAATSLRDAQTGSLATGQSYSEDLINSMRDNLGEFEKLISPALHNSPHASAFTNLITGGNIRPLIISRFQVDEQFAAQATRQAQDVQQTMDTQRSVIPATEEEAEAIAQRNLYPFDPKNLIRPRKEQDDAIKRSFGNATKNGNLQSVIDILRSSSLTAPTQGGQ